MRTNFVIRNTNSVIGCLGSLIGLVLFGGSLLWFLGVLFSEAFQALVVGIPIPNDPLDFVTIFSALFMGGFFMAWGGAMLQRREWGALVGGLMCLILTIYLLVGAGTFYQNFVRQLPSSALSFYNRYVLFIWTIFGLVILWLVTTSFILLFSKGRRDYYARSYQDFPAPASLTCPQCGLMLQEGRCPEHDVRRRTAYLKIGERRESLPFTEDDRAFVIGRQKEKSEAFITLSKEDSPNPERISGQHARIQYHFDYQQFLIQDLVSTNKTYLNDSSEPLSPSRLYRLANGDKIDLAHVVNLIFECDD